MEKEELRKRIGINMMNRRVAMGLTMEEVSGLMDFSPSFIGLMERGSRGVTAYNIHKLAEIFECRQSDFFREVEPISEEENKTLSQEDLQKKLLTLTYNLDEKELTFLVKTVENLNRCRKKDTSSIKSI